MDNSISRLQRQLYQLVRFYELCDRACLGQNSVTPSQGYTLLSFPENGDLNMNQLSEMMMLSNSTMTRMIDQLVQKGLAFRKADEVDRRVVRVELTGQGREVRHTLEQALQCLFSQILNEIPEEERSTVLDALEQVTRAVAKALDIGSCCLE